MIKVRTVYNDNDKSIIGFLAEDIDKDEHLAVCEEGIKVTDNLLVFDSPLIALDEVVINSNGEAEKV